MRKDPFKEWQKIRNLKFNDTYRSLSEESLESLKDKYNMLLKRTLDPQKEKEAEQAEKSSKSSPNSSMKGPSMRK